MRLLLAVLAATLQGAPLTIVNPIAHQMEDGPATTIPRSFATGETVFFSFQADQYKASPDDRVRLKARIQAFDPKGVPLHEPVEAIMDAEITPQDKEWKPKFRAQVAIPPLALPGEYRIHVILADEIAGTTAEKSFPIVVTGREIPETGRFTIANMGFYRGEDDQRPLSTPAYRPGDTVWVHFVLAGYRYGPENQVDVEYGVTVLSPSGKVLFSQPKAAEERSQSFYPKRYLPNTFSLNIQPDTKPGEFTVIITAKDNVGQQTAEQRRAFSVE